MESKIRNDRLAVKPGFPVWDMAFGIFFGPRYIDISRPGIAYMVIPEFIKEPMPILYNIYGKETVTTGAGTFSAYKIGFSGVTLLWANYWNRS